MSLRSPSRPWFWTAVVLLVATASAGAASRKKPKPPRCAGGYFLVDGDPLLAGYGGTDALVVGLGAASTRSGCPARKAQVFRAKPAGVDELVVRWPECGARRKAVLQARISPDCATVEGTFRAKGVKRRRFVARDGIPDALRVPWDGAELPPGSEVVSPAEFVDAASLPGFRILGVGTPAEDEAAAVAEDEANRATLAEFAATHPDRADYVSTGVDPENPDLQRGTDGNYRLTIPDAVGNPQEVVTQSARVERAVRADAIRRYPTKENQLAIYAARYASVQSLGQWAMPRPEDLAESSAAEIAYWNEEVAAGYHLAEDRSILPGETVSASHPARCTLEIGAGDGTDGAGYCRRASLGLWNTATWPLKYYDTCIKNQANRGSCVAFAITAGRELRIAKKYDRWINLSEQHLYGTAKLILRPTNYGDGLPANAILQQLRDTNYQQPLESEWDYNPSRSRKEDDEAEKYTDSCVDYTGNEAPFCSDTAHQARILCTQTGSRMTCAAQLARYTGTTVRSLDQPAELWDPTDPVRSLANLIWTVRIEGTPVLLSVAVVRSLGRPDPNGFVSFNPQRPVLCATVGPEDPAYDPARDNCIRTASCECADGGHAMLAVGYVPPDLLPATAPTPSGGGGYLIVKNSWGCSGDGGYYYLPAAWLRAFVRSARPIGDVETSAPLPEQPTEPGMVFDYRPVPPSIRIVQPTIGESYVAGQGVPLFVTGADYDEEGWALLGATQWTSDLDGVVGQGPSALAMLREGTHQLTVSYTGKKGMVVRSSTSVVVGPRPPDVPPTARFTRFAVIPGNECPVACGSQDCVVGFGDGIDPEDGFLSGANVRWYSRVENGPNVLRSTGPSNGNQGKFLYCGRLCGYTWHFTLEVQDSQGQTASARQDLETPGCVN